jgi:catechol 2,3-dioxygenase-like lactoylglutathione lyase family enzyme
MDWKIEMIPVPVTDVDRAKKFFAEQIGWPVDVDHATGDDFRIVQLTPPGSGCSIAFGTGVSPVFHYEGTERVDGPGGRWNSFAEFPDPDGNRWVLQEQG